MIFPNVKIHTGSVASKSAESINALAYTSGNSIVFNKGQYAPSTDIGKKLLAHELTHVIQQQPDHVNRKTTKFGPASTGIPADWAKDVKAAATSSDKVALIQKALGKAIGVVDKTTQMVGDDSPIAARLEPYHSSKPAINYDENLNTKKSSVDSRSLKNNAGYTLHSGGKYYIILGPKALKASHYYHVVTILNHEFDHIRQAKAKSKLKGDESELDAWTSTFIRDFHRTYILGDTGTTCFVQSIQQYAPLLFYFTRSKVSSTEKDKAVKRIEAYFNTKIKSHVAHSKVFRYWIHRTIVKSSIPDLAQKLNGVLRLGIKKSDPLKNTRQFPCGSIKLASFPSPPKPGKP